MNDALVAAVSERVASIGEEAIYDLERGRVCSTRSWPEPSLRPAWFSKDGSVIVEKMILGERPLGDGWQVVVRAADDCTRVLARVPTQGRGQPH